MKSTRGGIDVQAESGGGTRFRLAFPRSLAPAEPLDAQVEPGPLAGWETLLLVEDDPAVRESTQRILSAIGYTVLAAGDAESARRVFHAHRHVIQLLLTDVIMPGVSGPALAAELVAAHPGLRVLYMSGYTADELGPHGLARPEAPLLRKPFTTGQLTRRLRSTLAAPPGRL
jgi:DNA-binding NtrC family response regulator